MQTSQLLSSAWVFKDQEFCSNEHNPQDDENEIPLMQKQTSIESHSCLKEYEY